MNPKNKNMKSATFFSLLFLLMLLNLSSFGQNINIFASAFLEKYEIYAGLTEDGISISEDYIEEFSDLFYSNDALIYNDIKSGYSEKEYQLPLKQYIKYIQRWYPKGITDIKLSDIKFSDPRKAKKKDSYIIEVSMTKTLIGLYDNKRFEEVKHQLKMELTYSKQGNDYVFKILEISNPVLAPEKNMELGFYFTPGISTMSAEGDYTNPQNSYEDFKSSGNFGYKLSFNFSYFFNKFIGVGIGVGYSSINSELELKSIDQQNLLNQEDDDGDSYNMFFSANNMKEKITVNYLNIPIEIRLKKALKSRIINYMYLNIGGYVSYQISNSLNIKGKGTYRAYYPAYDIELFNIEEYGYYENKPFDTESNSSFSEISYGISGSLGVTVPFNLLNKDLNLDIGIRYSMSLGNIYNSESDFISNKYGNYNSLLSIKKDTFIQFLGVRVGLNFPF